MSKVEEAATRGKKAAKLGYVRHLDGLRAISIIAVMIVHMANSKRLGKGGWIGIDVFFVLSGFLITVLLLEDGQKSASGRPSLPRFYLRRVFRLLPALFVFLGLVLVFAALYRRSTYGLWAHELFLGATYRMNFYVINHAAIQGLGATWTLCMEEQFYLIWPIALVLLSVVLRRKVLMSVVAAGVVVSVALNVFLYMHGASSPRLSYSPDTNASSLLLGCLAGLAFNAGYLHRLGNTRFAQWFPVAFLALLAGWTLVIGSSNRLLYAGPTTVFCGLAAIAIVCLVVAPASGAGRLLAWAPLVWIGRLSYSLYLWNELVFKLAPRIGPGSIGTLGRVVAAIVLVFAIAMGSYYLIEQPFLRLKKRTDLWFAARPLEPALAAVTAGGPAGAMSDEAEPKDVISASPVA